MADKEIEEAPTYVLSRDPHFRSVYASGVYGGLDPLGGQMIFYVDQIEPAIDEKTGTMKVEKIVRNQIVDIRMTPAEFLSLADWMTKHAENYKKRIREMHESQDPGRAPRSDPWPRT